MKMLFTLVTIIFFSFNGDVLASDINYEQQEYIINSFQSSLLRSQSTFAAFCTFEIKLRYHLDGIHDELRDFEKTMINELREIRADLNSLNIRLASLYQWKNILQTRVYLYLGLFIGLLYRNSFLSQFSR